MKLRNIDMVVIMNNIDKFKDMKLPQRISYAITKNNMLLIEEQKVYMEEFNKITKEYIIILLFMKELLHVTTLGMIIIKKILLV